MSDGGIDAARTLFARGNLYQAERSVRALLRAQGDHIEGMRLLAQIALRLEVLDDAEVLLERVLILVPAHEVARYEFVAVLLRRHKPARARIEIDKLLQSNPTDRDYRCADAAVLMACGLHEPALQRYRALLAEAPADTELQLAVAHILKILGQAGAARDRYRAVAASRPGLGTAWWGLANLKTYRFSDAEIASMRQAHTTPGITPVQRYHFCFALGKALEDRGEYGESFEFYRHGNRLKRDERAFRPEVVETEAQLQRAVFTRALVESRGHSETAAPGPIFIVGLPRSGTTLLEQILASHSQVEATTELGLIPRLVQDLQGHRHDNIDPRYPGILTSLPAAEYARLGARYLADAAVYRRLGGSLFIDKNPNNFRHVGLIRLMFPSAFIIDARRQAMACCFSNYRQLFAIGHRFSYDFEHLARYYRCYRQLMQHWNAVLPGAVLCVQYEQLVDDLEGGVRRLLEFCGLDFEPACLEFHRTHRGIETASAEQVRSPLNRDGLDQWRHFEPWLTPLRAALGSLADDSPVAHSFSNTDCHDVQSPSES